MPNDINNLDPEDIGLKQIFGDRFHDETATSGAQQIKKQETTYTSEHTKAEQSGAHNRTKSFADAHWEPFKHEPTQMEKLVDSAKWALTFGGLSLLFFYWQQTGQMAFSASMPSICVCVALAGFGVGKNFAKEYRR